jgi:hypothetical protein
MAKGKGIRNAARGLTRVHGGKRGSKAAPKMPTIAAPKLGPKASGRKGGKY